MLDELGLDNKAVVCCIGGSTRLNEIRFNFVISGLSKLRLVGRRPENSAWSRGRGRLRLLVTCNFSNGNRSGRNNAASLRPNPLFSFEDASFLIVWAVTSGSNFAPID